jgi:hypothetical protein
MTSGKFGRPTMQPRFQLQEEAVIAALVFCCYNDRKNLCPLGLSGVRRVIA